jgi:hypothetical protein
MTEKERQALKERIASLINHGLSNDEIFAEYLKDVSASELIGVIRDLMEKPLDTTQSTHLGPANLYMKFEGRVIQTTIPPADLNNDNGGGGLEIRVPGYKNSSEDPHGAQIFIEEYQKKLRVHVWNGNDDPTTVEIDPAQ